MITISKSMNDKLTSILVGTKEYYFSYETLVAFGRKGRLTVCENVWGTTTGRHLNAIDGGHKESRVNLEEFQRLAQEFEEN